jgi:hypothetical protein
MWWWLSMTERLTCAHCGEPEQTWAHIAECSDDHGGQAPALGAALGAVAAKRKAEGWTPFGTHANPNDADTPCTYAGPLDFGPDGEDGLPDYERHPNGGKCDAIK